MAGASLEIVNISKRYPGVQALAYFICVTTTGALEQRHQRHTEHDQQACKGKREPYMQGFHGASAARCAAKR